MPKGCSFYYCLRLFVFFLCFVCQMQYVSASPRELSSGDFMEDDNPESVEKKADFLINASQFIRWPAISVHHLFSKHFDLCVLDLSSSADVLTQLEGREVGHQQLRINRLESLDQADHCRLVYIRGHKRPYMDSVMEQLAERGILSVGDSKLFAQAGGMMGLVYDNDKVTCYVNKRISERVGFKFSARFLEAVVLVD